MGLVTREILHTGRKTERVAVPEWDGEILLRALSAAQADRLCGLQSNALGDMPRRRLRSRGLAADCGLGGRGGRARC